MRAARARRAGRRGERRNEPDGTVRRAQGIRGRRRRDRGDPEGRRRATVAPRRASAPGGVGGEGVQGKAERSPILPPRISLDSHGAALRADIVRHPVEVNNGLLTRVRAGRYRAGVVRVVIDLERESGDRVVDLSGPSRIIVEVDGAAEGGGGPAVPGAGGTIG